tara:strand:- start:242 stop:388 length:147 start_codon:yes stop_codon:yes gene_type:complete
LKCPHCKKEVKPTPIKQNQYGGAFGKYGGAEYSYTCPSCKKNIKIVKR